MTTGNAEHAPLPEIKPAEQLAMKEYWEIYKAHKDEVSKEILAVVGEVPVWAALLKSMTPQQMAEQDKKSTELQRLALVEGKWQPYVDDLRVQGITYARAGISFSAWLPVFTSFRDAMRPRFLAMAQKDPKRIERAMDGMDRLLDIAVGLLGEAYVAAKEQIIEKQQQAIRELSTPVLQVRENLLILPVVGMIDTDRTKHLTASLLKAIRDRRARVVVMDVTGVPIVDSKVANHLVQACEAARLMGSTVIVTGISPEIAQALVTIGAELRNVRTVGDLQGGIEEANRILGYQVNRAG